VKTKEFSNPVTSAPSGRRYGRQCEAAAATVEVSESGIHVEVAMVGNLAVIF